MLWFRKPFRHRFSVSDLHLGDKGPRDNFAAGDGEVRFGKFLDYVEAMDGELIILGDLFEWWQFNLSLTVKAYRDLLDRLAAMQAKWVMGNHDGALRHLLGTSFMPEHAFFQGASGPFTSQIAGKTFVYLHGHEGDPYCLQDNPGIGQMTAVISALLEDRHGAFRGNRAVEDLWLQPLEAMLSVYQRLQGQPGRLQQMAQQADRFCQEQNGHVVLYGHTHQPGQRGDTHFNTGCWCRRLDTFAQTDLATAATTLWQWTADNTPAPYHMDLAV